MRTKIPVNIQKQLCLCPDPSAFATHVEEFLGQRVSMKGSQTRLDETTYHSSLGITLLTLEEDCIACTASRIWACLVDVGQLYIIIVSAVLLEVLLETSRANKNATNDKSGLLCVSLLSLLFLSVDILVIGIGRVVDLQILATVGRLVAGRADNALIAVNAELGDDITHRWIRCHILDDTCSFGYVSRELVSVNAGGAHLGGP